ncbi:MAG: hypothetical protein AAFO75_13925, partial [Pseudomonadota bacterium]
ARLSKESNALAVALARMEDARMRLSESNRKIAELNSMLSQQEDQITQVRWGLYDFEAELVAFQSKLRRIETDLRGASALQGSTMLSASRQFVAEMLVELDSLQRKANELKGLAPAKQ